MLPLDEDPFEIDANKRAISVPAAFKSGVSVQGDIVAETLLFRIDRFFDAIDFNDCDIYVQWERPNDKTQYVTPLKGTAADLIDIESQPGKIIFGWPLSAEVTRNPGTVKFSIRFIKFGNDSTIAYSFSTLTSSITINPGLDYDIANSTQDSASELFDAIISNSESSTGAPAAKPFFEVDLNANNSYLGEDNKATLSVLADTTDNGIVRYEWYASKNPNAIGTRVKEDYPEDEVASVYTVDATNTSDITGYYWVKAINRFTNKEKSAFSKKTCFPGANEPAFSTQPQDTMLTDGTAVVAVTMMPDAHGEHNSVDYVWYRKVSSADDFIAIEDSNANEYIALIPGVYKVMVTNTVNADSKSNMSASCTIYNVPGEVVFGNLESDEMIKGNTYTLPVELPEDEFARGTILYSLWFDYDDADGILVNGIPSTTDKVVEIEGGLTEPKFTIDTSMLEAAAGSKLYCIAANTIEVNGNAVTTYSQSTGYTLNSK